MQMQNTVWRTTYYNQELPYNVYVRHTNNSGSWWQNLFGGYKKQEGIIVKACETTDNIEYSDGSCSWLLCCVRKTILYKDYPNGVLFNKALEEAHNICIALVKEVVSEEKAKIKIKLDIKNMSSAKQHAHKHYDTLPQNPESTLEIPEGIIVTREWDAQGAPVID